jgi:hypothetical protein
MSPVQSLVDAVSFFFNKKGETNTALLKAFRKFAADRKSALPVSLQLSSPQNPKMEKLAANMAHDRNKASKHENH